MSVELVLIMTVMLAVFLVFTRWVESEEFIENLSINPWNSNIAGMIENGVWGTPEQTRINHPHAAKRHVSVRGEPVR
ncbi:MAG: hypothetical protein SGJ18_14390 [Pseudomonadota bacterium]|nr:hypothetical protein [Pseudomonadota bacterium]